MATSRKQNTPTPTPTPASLIADTVKLVKAVSDADKAGKASVADATRAAFDSLAGEYVALGVHLATNIAPHLAAGVALTGENIAKLFAKDGALYPSDQDDRDALKSANTYLRALTLRQFDSDAMRTLFVSGPDAAMLAKHASLTGVTGHSASVMAYYDWLRVMNASTIALVKAIPADTLAKWTIYVDSETGATIYAKRKPVSQADAAKIVKVKRADMPVIARLAEADHDALVKLVADSRFDIDVKASDLAAYAEYFGARYLLSLTAAPDDAPVAPAAKQTTF